jgi:3',5'-cyclic AMP phosphodiesterase CpdA
MELRVVQISDSHLSGRGGVTRSNLRRLVRFINEELRPDVVVHSGDVIALRPGTGSDFRAAREILDELVAPYQVVPGNHDVGHPGAEPWMGLGTGDEHVAEYREVFGEIPWLRVLNQDWVAFGVADMLFGSGTEAEAEQWAWLEENVPTAAGRQAMVFTHRPVHSPLSEGPAAGQVGVPAAERATLLGLFAPGQLRVLANGHLHRYRRSLRDEVVEVWAPATSSSSQQEPPVPFPAALSQVGVVEYRIQGDTVLTYFRSVPDVEDIELMEIPEIRAEMAEIQGAAAGATSGGAA